MKKRRIIKVIVVFVLAALFPYSVIGQVEKVEQITVFGNRINNPIKIEKRNNKISFIAINKSYFPYTIEIKFSTLVNLFTKITTHSAIVQPGRNTILSLSVIDVNASHDYAYSYKYHLGSMMDEPNLDYPYLIPIGVGKVVDFQQDSRYFYINNFKMHNYDSVYCMRKGVVTALPDLRIETERIIKTGSLEIRHKDGTVAVYRNIDAESCKLIPGETVYPSQFLGKISNEKNLVVTISEQLT